MANNPIGDLPLHHVMRQEIALTMQYILQIYTVGGFVAAWRSPKRQRSIEQVFDTPQQARHAAAVCGTWLGHPTVPIDHAAGAWWPTSQQPSAS